MNSTITTSIVQGHIAASLVDPFYEQNGFRGRARPDDIFFLAKLENELVGSVRYCVEEQTPMLRTMMIAPQCRRQKVGLTLLENFAAYLDERDIHNVFCLPYSHLGPFYSQIGFEQVPVAAAPLFLQQRLQEYAERGEQNICMKRA